MSTFAIARLQDVEVGPDIVHYLERIDATLAPFGGRFRVHGDPYDVIEGSWAGDVVIIEFPDRAAARNWYGSAAYQAILPLRTENAACDVILIDTVDEGHRATDILAG
ncbi:DUF1330 domain-containing protein [Enterovirga sp. CN4-39]